mgnify:CR=1 FL=1
MGGILVKHADACERSSLFNASAPLVLKVGCLTHFKPTETTSNQQKWVAKWVAKADKQDALRHALLCVSVKSGMQVLLCLK